MSKKDNEPMILEGDCVEVMKEFDENTFDAIVTDPPYLLEFMGRAWDKAKIVENSRFCSWLAGFADGESNFDIHRQVRNGKEYYYCRFEITLREDDNSILELIKRRIGGKVYYHSNKCRLELVAKHECMQLVSIFEQFPLQAKKKRDFDIWKKALKISVDNHGKSRPELMKPFWIKLRATRSNKGIDDKKISFNYGGDFHYIWLTEAYRILKPGGSILVMGGTRTFHRLMVAIEDSGFIIKDCLMWIYGSGFPKAQDLGKMIDKRMGVERKVVGINPNSRRLPPAGVAGNYAIHGKSISVEKAMEYHRNTNPNISIPASDLAKHWDGFKIGGIKPAYEPIVWAVKPPEGSYIDNVLKWGVGAVNVDECRIETEDDCKRKPSKLKKDAISYIRKDEPMFGGQGNPKGRFPANIILDEEAGRVMDEMSGALRARGNTSPTKRKQSDGITGWGVGPDGAIDAGDSGGASRFFYCAKASRGERNKGLEELEDKLHGQSGGTQGALKEGDEEYKQDNIGLNRIKKVKNNHPTVKPIKLFEYLIKLVTRKGQIIIDPFLGSGTTMIAANNVDRECVGIEREGEYIPIAEKRVEYWLKEKEKND